MGVVLAHASVADLLDFDVRQSGVVEQSTKPLSARDDSSIICSERNDRVPYLWEAILDRETVWLSSLRQGEAEKVEVKSYFP